MLGMIFWIFGVDQDVINEDHNKLVEFLHEDRIHEVHEISWSVSETKRHDKILVQTIPGGESCFWNITGPNLNLMIAGTKINLREYLCSG
jgi:hypothetical protein